MLIESVSKYRVQEKKSHVSISSLCCINSGNIVTEKDNLATDGNIVVFFGSGLLTFRCYSGEDTENKIFVVELKHKTVHEDSKGDTELAEDTVEEKCKECFNKNSSGSINTQNRNISVVESLAEENNCKITGMSSCGKDFSQSSEESILGSAKLCGFTNENALGCEQGYFDDHLCLEYTENCVLCKKIEEKGIFKEVCDKLNRLKNTSNSIKTFSSKESLHKIIDEKYDYLSSQIRKQKVLCLSEYEARISSFSSLFPCCNVSIRTKNRFFLYIKYELDNRGRTILETLREIEANGGDISEVEIYKQKSTEELFNVYKTDLASDICNDSIVSETNYPLKGQNTNPESNSEERENTGKKNMRLCKSCFFKSKSENTDSIMKRKSHLNDDNLIKISVDKKAATNHQKINTEIHENQAYEEDSSFCRNLLTAKHLDNIDNETSGVAAFEANDFGHLLDNVDSTHQSIIQNDYNTSHTCGTQKLRKTNDIEEPESPLDFYLYDSKNARINRYFIHCSDGVVEVSLDQIKEKELDIRQSKPKDSTKLLNAHNDLLEIDKKIYEYSHSHSHSALVEEFIKSSHNTHLSYIKHGIVSNTDTLYLVLYKINNYCTVFVSRALYDYNIMLGILNNLEENLINFDKTTFTHEKEYQSNLCNSDRDYINRCRDIENQNFSYGGEHFDSNNINLSPCSMGKNITNEDFDILNETRQTSHILESDVVSFNQRFFHDRLEKNSEEKDVKNGFLNGDVNECKNSFENNRPHLYSFGVSLASFLIKRIISIPYLPNTSIKISINGIIVNHCINLRMIKAQNLSDLIKKYSHISLDDSELAFFHLQKALEDIKPMEYPGLLISFMTSKLSYLLDAPIPFVVVLSKAFLDRTKDFNAKNLIFHVSTQQQKISTSSKKRRIKSNYKNTNKEHEKRRKKFGIFEVKRKLSNKMQMQKILQPKLHFDQFPLLFNSSNMIEKLFLNKGLTKFNVVTVKISFKTFFDIKKKSLPSESQLIDLNKPTPENSEETLNPKEYSNEINLTETIKDLKLVSAEDAGLPENIIDNKNIKVSVSYPHKCKLDHSRNNLCSIESKNSFYFHKEQNKSKFGVVSCKDEEECLLEFSDSKALAKTGNRKDAEQEMCSITKQRNTELSASTIRFYDSTLLASPAGFTCLNLQDAISVWLFLYRDQVDYNKLLSIRKLDYSILALKLCKDKDISGLERLKQRFFTRKSTQRSNSRDSTSDQLISHRKSFRSVRTPLVVKRRLCSYLYFKSSYVNTESILQAFANYDDTVEIQHFMTDEKISVILLKDESKRRKEAVSKLAQSKISKWPINMPLNLNKTSIELKGKLDAPEQDNRYIPCSKNADPHSHEQHIGIQNTMFKEDGNRCSSCTSNTDATSIKDYNRVNKDANSKELSIYQKKYKYDNLNRDLLKAQSKEKRILKFKSVEIRDLRNSKSLQRSVFNNSFITFFIFKGSIYKLLKSDTIINCLTNNFVNEQIIGSVLLYLRYYKLPLESCSPVDEKIQIFEEEQIDLLGKEIRTLYL